MVRFQRTGRLDGLRGGVDNEHALDEGFELGEFELAGGVAEGLGGAGVGF